MAEINEFEKVKGAPSTIKERFNILTEIVSDLSKNNKLNLMIYDGDLTYIHSNMRETLYYLKSYAIILIIAVIASTQIGKKLVEIRILVKKGSKRILRKFHIRVAFLLCRIEL